MKTQLYKYDGTPLFEVIVDDTSTQDWSLMSDNKLSVSFELEECVVLTAGCYIDFDSTRFYLLNEYKPTMICSSVWKYDLTLGDAASWLSITLALKTIDGENTPLFKYTGPAAEHAAIIVANLNRRMGTDQWKVGSVISTENIAIDYSGKYCSDVLQEIVDAKNTEWWIDGMTLNIGRAEFGERVTLGYMNGALGDIVCDTAGDMRSYAYLFPIGSTRNIDPTKYGHDRLQLPSGLKSVPINPEQGVAELVEEAAFAHIYPRYEGTVSAVRYAKATNADGTPFLIYYIKDTAIPFNPNEFEIPGLVKHITFQSGELMGQEFEVNYSADSNEFELITRWTGDIQLPGGVLVPAVGDKYVVWNISMPDVYYTIASHELLDAARAYAADAIKDVSVYKVKLDYVDVQERGLKLRPGQRVRLLSDMYFASGYYDSRITRITRNIAYPDALSVDISAVRVVGTLSRLQASIQKTENVVAQFSGQLPAIIKSNDDTSADDSSVYTSAKSEKEFLNKRKGGKVSAPVTFDDVAEFLNGLVAHKYIKIGNGYLRYNDELGVWEMEGDLLVTGAVTMFGSLSGFKPSTIMDAVLVDGTTIVKTKNSQGQWQLTAIGGGGGTGGGNLTAAEVNLLIENALKPYALSSSIPTDNKQLENGAGYITAAALNGYATQSWVEGKKYLTGITSSQVTTALGYTPYNSSNPDKYIKGIDYDMIIAALGYTPYSTTNPMGYLTISSLLGYATEQWVGDNYLASSNFTKANIKSTLGISDWALAATKPSYTAAEVGALSTSGGSVSSDDYQPLIVNSNFSSGVEDVRIGISHNWNVKGIFNWESNGVGLRMYNTSCGSAIGIKDDGTPYYDSYELIHLGNYSKYALPIKGGAIDNIQVYSTTSINPLSVAGNNRSGFIGIGSYSNGVYSRYGLISFPDENGSLYRYDNSYNGFEIIDSNNIGSYNAGSATTFKGVKNAVSAFDLNTVLSGGGLLRNYGSTSFWGNAPSGSTYGIVLQLCYPNYDVGLNGQLLWDVNHGSTTDTTKSLWWRAADGNSGWANSKWHQIAFTDSNVASATKLQTARTIWGQSFDGTQDLNKSLIIGNTQSSLLPAWQEYIGICATGTGLSGWVAEFGNGTKGILLGCRGNNYDIPSIGAVNATDIAIAPDGGNVAIGGTTADAKLHIHGDAKINGDLLTTGAITMFSQLSMKNVIDYGGLSLAQLAQIKPARFTWKDGRDNRIHVGGIADEVMQMLPEVIYRTSDDKLTMDYGSAAFYIGTSLIKPVIDHERRISDLERENKQLKQQLERLSAA